MHFVKNSTERLFNWFYKPFLAYPDKTERIVYLLIFLFPIAGMSVRHWITNIFNLLVLISLFTLRKPREPLLKEEKIFLWICLSYFSMFIISSLANGWGQAQTYYLGTELRFIMVIPLYILVRRYTDCSLWLLRGAIIGGFFLIGQALYDIFIIGNTLALGVYSKNLTGPYAVLTGFWILYFLSQNFRNFKWGIVSIIFLSATVAFITAGLSGSRGSYVGFIVTSFACVLFFSKPRWMFASILVILTVTLQFYLNMPTVKNGVDTAINEYKKYFYAEDHVNDPSSETSVGVRLEMIRTGILFVKENPFIGIGPGNYLAKSKQYIKSRKANPAIGKYAYPHNTYLEVASAKGLIGLITLILLLYYPSYIYIKDYKKYKTTAVLGLIHIVAISSFALTDHSVVVKNNYTSILLLGIAIFFSSHINNSKCKLN